MVQTTQRYQAIHNCIMKVRLNISYVSVLGWDWYCICSDNSDTEGHGMTYHHDCTMQNEGLELIQRPSCTTPVVIYMLK